MNTFGRMLLDNPKAKGKEEEEEKEYYALPGIANRK
jgi:hypothetical protein